MAAAQARATSAKADAELRKGQALIEERKLTEAADVFEAAYSELQDPTFLYNAAVCAEMAQELERAASLYEGFLKKQPYDPASASVRARIGLLKSAVGIAPEQRVTASSIRAIVKIDSDPSGASVSVYERLDSTAQPFEGVQPPNGWGKIGDKPFSTPAVFSLKAGDYRVVFEPTGDYKALGTDFKVSPGYVHELKAMLSQGEFLAFLRVSSHVEGAKIYLNTKPTPSAPVWGRTPFSDFVPAGSHTVWVEAPGFKQFEGKVEVQHGQTAELHAKLTRLPYGYARFDSVTSYFDVSVDESKPERFDWRKGPLKLELDGGPHRVHVTADGKKEYRGVFDVPNGQMLDVHVRFEEEFSYAAPITLTVLALGSGVATVLSWRQSEQLNDTRDMLVVERDKLPGSSAERAKLSEEIEATESDISIFERLTIGGGISSGVLALAAGFFYVDFGADTILVFDKPKEFDFDQPKKGSSSGALFPQLGPGFGGLTFRGVF
ncbi:MAG: PEGA domain-containing protein [Polyangiaceae bacterium]